MGAEGTSKQLKGVWSMEDRRRTDGSVVDKSHIEPSQTIALSDCRQSRTSRSPSPPSWRGGRGASCSDLGADHGT